MKLKVTKIRRGYKLKYRQETPLPTVDVPVAARVFKVAASCDALKTPL